MPAEPHINGWSQITVWWSDAGGAHSNVFSYKTTTQPGPIDVFTIAQAWYTFCGAAFKAVLGAQRNLDYVECRTRWVGINYSGTYYPPQPNPGGRANDAEPGNVAVVQSWKSGARGRSYNGRTFMGGLCEGDVSGDVIGSSLLIAYNTLDNLIGSFTNSGSIPTQFCVASVSKLVLTLIGKVVINAVADSMRRRLTGRGM